MTEVATSIDSDLREKENKIKWLKGERKGGEGCRNGGRESKREERIEVREGRKGRYRRGYKV